MDKIINQFKRNWYDHGSNDVDFTDQETKLRAAEGKLVSATTELVKASERLNKAALDVGVDATIPN